MSAQRLPATVLAVIALMVVASALRVPVPLALAASWLTNPDFENGNAGWAVISSSVENCTARTGGGALTLAAGIDSESAQASQNVPAANAPGTYALTGFIRLASGTPVSMTIRLIVNGVLRDAVVTPGPAWSPFTAEIKSDVPVSGVRVLALLSAASPTVVCLDDLHLEGPAALQPTATPTQTSTAEPTATETAAAAPTATATSTATVTVSTPGTTPSPSPTSTATPTATPLPLVFMNGGFEDGTTGWRTHGLEAATVGQPKRSGSAAGSFTSGTDSTKWAYQVVAIDPALAYQFAGHVMASSGVKEAYLRLSWYASTDGSGSALHSDDSATRAGPGGFVSLSTGAKTPPAGARSLRARVMIVPAGGGSGTVYLDDFTLVAGAPVAPPPTPSPVPALDDASVDEPPPPAGSLSPPTATSTAGTVTAEASATGTGTPAISGTAVRPALSQPTPTTFFEEPAPDGDPPIPWPYLAGPAATAAIAAGFIVGRRRGE